MASRRSWTDPTVRSGDARPRRVDGYTDPRTDIPQNTSQRARKQVGDVTTTASQSALPKMSSTRIPQTSSQMRPSLSNQAGRPPLNHQPQSWSSTGSAGSGRPAGNLTASSVAPLKSNLTAPGMPRPRNTLRRKRSGLPQDPSNQRSDSNSGSARTSSSSSVPRSQNSLDGASGAQFDRGLTQSPMEVHLAQRLDLPKTTAHTLTIYPELDRYREARPPALADNPNIAMPFRLATHDLPPPTPQFSGTSSQISGFSGSPSTRWSESPGPGPYSRDTTPTSMSSQSPGLLAPIRFPTPARARQASPAQTRPPVTRRRAASIPNEVDPISADARGLAAVRESLTSSSSNSTVRDGDKKDTKKKKGLSPLPPTPPPRKSSQKLRSRSDSQDEEPSPLKPSRAPVRPVMASQSRGNATISSPRKEPVPSPKAAPPSRPSRDGTPDLLSQLGLPMPVIQSNLSSASLSVRRHSSLISPASQPRPSLSSPRPEFAQTQRRPSFGQQSVQSDTGRATIRTPSPSVSTVKTRFPFFGRRTKPTAPEVIPPEKKDKPARKGPAAGTGHEGYGRLGAPRRRSGSVTNLVHGPSGAVSSPESLSSTDPFLMERIAPVVIAGGEVVENRNTSSEFNRTESNQSLPVALSGLDSRNSSRVSLSSKESTRLTLWPSAFPRGSSQSPSMGSRRPSDSSDSEALAMKSTLAYRRSMQKLKSGDQPVPRLPKPIATRAPVLSPSVTSLDASVMSDDSVFSPPPRPTRGRTQTDTPASTSNPKKLTKRVRSPRRWNFFGRSQSQPAVAKKKSQVVASTVAATVQAVESRPAAFYTMDFSEQEDADTQDLEDVLREARDMRSPFSGATKRRPSFSRPLKRPAPSPAGIPPSPRQGQTTQTVAPQNPVKATTPGPSVPSAQPPNARPVIGRPSRLPQVGRIPKVVSARPEQTSPKSFSRPFNRISVQLTAPGGEVSVPAPNTDFVAKGPSPPRGSTPELTQDESTTTGGTNQSSAQNRRSDDLAADAFQGTKEFLSFSPRKNSQSITTTSSSSSGILSFADGTAIVPNSSTPLAEDEVWDEYDDLLGEDTIKVPPSAGSSLGRPFHLEIYGTQLASKTAELALESPTVHVPETRTVDEVLQNIPEPITSSVYNTDITADIREAIDAAPVPETILSVTDIVSGLRNDRTDSMEVSVRGDAMQRSSTSSNARVQESRRSNASSSSQGSDETSPLAQVNLRVGSMTVSKWLTFGHVLFSPAREDLLQVVGSLKRHSILVVDGLGNDDWGFYAAETYPAATFFNLSPRAPLPEDHKNSTGFPLSPPNHHQIQYTSHLDKFPFGAQSFTSVVFRFPAAAPESHYRNIISEARRVLKPGGYIELAILDVDLNNMGNRGRRTVRRLKERIHANAPETCLGSAADLILRLLGRKGFVDIKTCRVGVPVASAITRSSASETTATDKGGAKKARAEKDERTLAEMMSDDSSVADESITKMVAKVGRWWYSQCYESAAGPVPALVGAGKSMWNDRALLAECEEWGTSLKLMVCHARVPESRSRVASI
ncbi:hypothetical protein GE09DRAFT_955235 [Coniochaeta sp. 2T2.1]|nr:hypothetical protein GE09DRAFT_955235 [Coniochaeta sp. 2T2.1]